MRAARMIDLEERLLVNLPNHQEHQVVVVLDHHHVLIARVLIEEMVIRKDITIEDLVLQELEPNPTVETEHIPKRDVEANKFLIYPLGLIERILRMMKPMQLPP